MKKINKYIILKILFIILVFYNDSTGTEGKRPDYIIDKIDYDGLSIFDANKIKNSCAANSAFIIIKKLGKNIKYSDLYRELEPAKSNISKLIKVLNNLGIETYFFIKNFNWMYNYKGSLFIIYTPPVYNAKLGHVFVATVLSDNTLKIIDPPNKAKIIKKGEWREEKNMNIIAIGNRFKLLSILTFQNILSSLLILGGGVLFAYGKFSRYHSYK